MLVHLLQMCSFTFFITASGSFFLIITQPYFPLHKRVFDWPMLNKVENTFLEGNEINLVKVLFYDDMAKLIAIKVFIIIIAY